MSMPSLVTGRMPNPSIGLSGSRTTLLGQQIRHERQGTINASLTADGRRCFPLKPWHPFASYPIIHALFTVRHGMCEFIYVKT
jgi:hypothetical protein